MFRVFVVFGDLNINRAGLVGELDFNIKKERMSGNKTGHFPKKVDIEE